jgi:hypothetical protein
MPQTISITILKEATMEADALATAILLRGFCRLLGLLGKAIGRNLLRF